MKRDQLLQDIKEMEEVYNDPSTSQEIKDSLLPALQEARKNLSELKEEKPVVVPVAKNQVSNTVGRPKGTSNHRSAREKAKAIAVPPKATKPVKEKVEKKPVVKKAPVKTTSAREAARSITGNAKKFNAGRSKENIALDKNIKAEKPGKRVSATGNIYYESRPNRSDVDRRKKLAEGGRINAGDVEALLNDPTVTVLVLSNDNPLSKQLSAITGDGWNAIDYTGEANLGELITHKATGRKFTTLNKAEAKEYGYPDKYAAKVIISDNDSYEANKAKLPEEDKEKLERLEAAYDAARLRMGEIGEELGSTPYISGNPLRWTYKVDDVPTDVPEKYHAELDKLSETISDYDTYIDELNWRADFNGEFDGDDDAEDLDDEEIEAFEKGGSVNKNFRISSDRVWYLVAKEYLKKTYGLEPGDIDLTKEVAAESFKNKEKPTEYIDAYAEKHDLDKINGGYYARGGRTKLAILSDKRIKALHPGKRESADGNIYYESRANRSDVNRRTKLEEGGQVSLFEEGGAIESMQAMRWWDGTLSTNEQKALLEKHLPSEDYVKFFLQSRSIYGNYKNKKKAIYDIWQTEGAPVVITEDQIRINKASAEIDMLDIIGYLSIFDTEQGNLELSVSNGLYFIRDDRNEDIAKVLYQGNRDGCIRFVADSYKFKFEKGGRTKQAIVSDKLYKAEHPGKRESASGETYYESRENRSDVNRTKKLKEGGVVDSIGAQMYKGYVLLTKPNNDAFGTLIYLQGEFVGGTFSTPRDKQSSIEKAQAKVDLRVEKNHSNEFLSGNIAVYDYYPAHFSMSRRAIIEFQTAVDTLNRNNASQLEKESLEKCAQHFDAFLDVLDDAFLGTKDVDGVRYAFAINSLLTAAVYNFKAGMLVDLFGIAPEFVKMLSSFPFKRSLEQGGAVDQPELFTGAEGYADGGETGTVMARGGLVVGKFYTHNGEKVRYIGEGLFKKGDQYIRIGDDESIYARGGALSEHKASKIADQLVEYYLPGVTPFFTTHGGASQIGEYTIEDDSNVNSRSKTTLIEVVCGDRYEDVLQFLDHDYDNYETFARELAREHGLNVQILSNDEYKTMTFELSKPSLEKGGSVSGKTYEVYLDCEAHSNDDGGELSFSTNDYEKAIAYAKRMSKESHPSKPANFEHTDYNYVANVYDTYSRQVIADFCDGEANYIDTPAKVYDKKYYLKSKGAEGLFDTRQPGLYYTEATGATNDLMEVVEARNRNGNMDRVKELLKEFGTVADLYNDTELEGNAHEIEATEEERAKVYFQNHNKYSKWAKSQDAATAKAGRLALALFHHKQVEGVQYHGIHYAEGGTVSESMSLAEYKGQTDPKADVKVMLEPGEYLEYNTADYNGTKITNVEVKGFPGGYVRIEGEECLYTQDKHGYPNKKSCFYVSETHTFKRGDKVTLNGEKVQAGLNTSLDPAVTHHFEDLISHVDEIGEIEHVGLGVLTIKFGSESIKAEKSYVVKLPSMAKGGVTKDEKTTLMTAAMYLTSYKWNHFKKDQVGFTEIEKIVTTFKDDPKDYGNINMAILNLKNYKEHVTANNAKAIDTIISDMTVMAKKYLAESKTGASKTAKVVTGLVKGKYVVIDVNTKTLWANEYFKTHGEAVDFIQQNKSKITLIGGTSELDKEKTKEEGRPYFKLTDLKYEAGGKTDKLLPDEYYQSFKLRGNGRREYNIFQSHDQASLRQAGHQLFPNKAYEFHKEKAKEYADKSKAATKEYNEFLESQFEKEFGRKVEATDYKVSGIWTNDFSQEAKDKLRGLLKQHNSYADAAYLHNAMLKKADRAVVKYAEGGEIDLPYTTDDQLHPDQMPELANDFATLMREQLTPEEINEVNRLNKTEEYKGACATHDYLDANMVMLEAWQKKYKSDPDLNNQRHMDYINSAWTIAKETDFNTENTFKAGGKLKRTKQALFFDKNLKAFKPGKRESASGNTYYEYRSNRTDLDRRKKLAEGGEVSRLAPMNELKKGEYFRFPGKKSVKVYDGYNRSNKSWDFYDFDDVNKFGSRKSIVKVEVDFDF